MEKETYKGVGGKMRLHGRTAKMLFAVPGENSCGQSSASVEILLLWSTVVD